MPNYDYVCTQCGHQEEIFQKITADPLTTCSSCQQPTFKRKPGGGIGLKFQGSGFYINDYSSQPSASKEKEAFSSKGQCGCGKNSCK